jgi:hypothetical protein
MVISLLGGGFQWLAGVILTAIGARARIVEAGVDALPGLVYSAADFRLAMLMLPMLSFIGFLLCFKMKETFSPTHL